jgi:uncharacterized protein YqgC (DUF456 family)
LSYSFVSRDFRNVSSCFAGLLLSICGLLIYKFGTDADLPMIYVWAFGILTVASVVLNYVIPAKTNQKYGGTLGKHRFDYRNHCRNIFTYSFRFSGGMFAGVFIGELLHDSKDMNKALKSTKGAFIGFIYGTGFSLVVGVAMFLVVLLDMLNII